jgi:acyl carrier protein
MPRPLELPEIQKWLCSEIEVLLACRPASVTAQSTLQSLGMDSLKLVSLLIAIEKHCGVNLMKSGLKRQDLATVGSLAAAVHASRPT